MTEPGFREGGYSVDEEFNAFVVGLPEDERTEAIADRDFEKSLRCVIIDGMFVTLTGPELSDEAMAEMTAYIRSVRAGHKQEATGGTVAESGE